MKSQGVQPVAFSRLVPLALWFDRFHPCNTDGRELPPPRGKALTPPPRGGWGCLDHPPTQPLSVPVSREHQNSPRILKPLFPSPALRADNEVQALCCSFTYKIHPEPWFCVRIFCAKNRPHGGDEFRSNDEVCARKN